ncbi:hypothetical protein VPH35_116304 [Triticum aestivum]|uniref:Endonuclease/exonuclease/phosphatase domain-containing protein n=1 Tax=Aegilops tauschii subsp. strangulata TaxID=200361 RepID=A0A453NH12_AEGTS
MGVDQDIFEIIAWSHLDFSVSCELRHKCNGNLFRVITMYGSPYEEGKGAFISELHTLFVDFKIPTLIGGDFNLVRNVKEKSNGVINHRWSDNFSVRIEIWGLLEIKLSSRKFTWANNQVDFIMSTIDRLFCNTGMDVLYPLASCKSLSRCGSDHTLLLWDSRVNSEPRKSSFKMEKWWLLRADFTDLVHKTWSEPNRATSTIENWQIKIRSLRRVTKGWNSNEEANLRRYKKILLEEFDMLDIRVENSDLSEVEFNRMKFIQSELQKIWLREEIKAKERSRDRDITEGDRNTAYFHAVANQRRRKTLIHSLDSPNGPVSDIKNMLNVASDFYKDLFKNKNSSGLKIKTDFFSAGEKVTPAENEVLEAPFTEEEVK